MQQQQEGAAYQGCVTIDWSKPIETVPDRRWPVAMPCEVVDSQFPLADNKARVSLPVEHGAGGKHPAGENWLYLGDGSAWIDSGKGDWPRVRNAARAESPAA